MLVPGSVGDQLQGLAQQDFREHLTARYFVFKVEVGLRNSEILDVTGARRASRNIRHSSEKRFRQRGAQLVAIRQEWGGGDCHVACRQFVGNEDLSVRVMENGTFPHKLIYGFRVINSQQINNDLVFTLFGLTRDIAYQGRIRERGERAPITMQC